MRAAGDGTAASVSKKSGRKPALLAGAVLAGGESRRMGSDKALLRVNGEALWRRQVRVLRRAGAEPVAVIRREGQAGLGRGAKVLQDVFIGAGPLAGLHAALAAAEGPWVAVLAVDMPAMEAAWFLRLRGLCRRGCGAVARHRDGFEPLAAIYPVEALRTVVGRLRRGEGSMQDLVRALIRGRRLAVVELTENERRVMANWNAPQEAGGRMRRRMAGA